MPSSPDAYPSLLTSTANSIESVPRARRHLQIKRARSSTSPGVFRLKRRGWMEGKSEPDVGLQRLWKPTPDRRCSGLPYSNAAFKRADLMTCVAALGPGGSRSSVGAAGRREAMRHALARGGVLGRRAEILDRGRSLLQPRCASHPGHA